MCISFAVRLLSCEALAVDMDTLVLAMWAEFIVVGVLIINVYDRLLIGDYAYCYCCYVPLLRSF
jgi:hypothetical protein